MASQGDHQPFPPPEPGLDAVVRAQLDAEAARADAGKVWANVLGRLDADGPAPTPPRRPWRTPLTAVIAVAGLAVAILVAVFVIPPGRDAAASPAEVVRAARDAHGRGPDRCYAQTLSLPPGSTQWLPLVADGERRAVVCVRGDRFVVEPGLGGTGAWGRDELGRVWIAPTKDAAARFAPGELPPAVAEAVRIRGLELDSLLDSVLADFDLTWGELPAPWVPLYTIAATRRTPAAPFQLASAELAIEADTNLIRTLTLHRALPSGATATLTFSLESTAETDPAAYTAEGHLAPGAPVFDGTALGARRLVLLRHLGRLLKNGL